MNQCFDASLNPGRIFVSYRRQMPRVAPPRPDYPLRLGEAGRARLPEIIEGFY
jgi:hypothetical protein